MCLAENIPDYDSHLKHLTYASLHSNTALRLLQRAIVNDPVNGQVNTAMLTTTQAVDLIEGGVKVNALPEKASVIVNHRISGDR